MFGRKTTVAALASLLLVMGAHAAVADESGSFSMLRSSQYSYVTVEHVDESYTGGTLKGTQTILDSSGGPFVDGMHSTVECLVFARSSDDGIAIEAPCVNTDLDGDHLYTTSIRELGTVETGGGGAGRWELRGGTGKYAGITGSCGYEAQYLAGNSVVSLGECNWSKS